MNSLRSGHLLFPFPDALKIGSEAYFGWLWENVGKRKCLVMLGDIHSPCSVEVMFCKVLAIVFKFSEVWKHCYKKENCGPSYQHN